jgi:SAM-dependent methyltransferase
MGARASGRRVSGETRDWIPAALLELAEVHRAKAEHDADRIAHAERDATRHADAQAAILAAGTAGIAGVCPLCEAQRTFRSFDHGAPTPDFREGLVCDGCGTNARVRAALTILHALCPDRAAPVYITEQTSAAYIWLHKHRTAVTGSEFASGLWRRAMLTAWLVRRGVFEHVRREDVTRLSLATASQHAVASFDVLEHVPDDRAALHEFARVTVPEGWLLLTVPFAGEEHGRERARVHGDGRIEHLHPPEYHGDPLGGGTLCLRQYGWDLLDALRAAGYRRAAIAFPWRPEAGLFEGLATIVAQR